MSTTAPSATAMTHNAPIPHRQPSSDRSDMPHRTSSLASRTASTIPPRANSSAQIPNSPPTASRQATSLASMARRDYEQSNLAQIPSSRRSSMGDRRSPERMPQQDRPRSTQRASSRSNRPPHASDQVNTAATTSETHGPTVARVESSTQGVPRRRTTITAQTGEWSLGKTIGAGSMGKVKVAKHLQTGEQCAIKIVPRLSTDEHRTQEDRDRADHSKEVRTAREAAIVTLVNHPYICGMRDVVRTHYHWYMLFEYVDGGQMLDYIISHGRLKEKQARKFARQIASALDYCHRNSIVHRDLKIENILISKTGDIKIIDFGLSNLFSPRSQLKTFCGSLYFAAPELLQAKQYTGPEVDVWSFGIVLYVLVCGKVPFDDQSMPQLHAKIKKGLVEYPPWLSADCKDIISRMLVTDPRNRATLAEIMNHTWMTKGFNGPPDNCLPHREPIQLPLDREVIKKMTGFDFGSAEYITKQLEIVVNSEEYQRAIRTGLKKTPTPASESDRKRASVFDFYQRRKSSSSRDTLTKPSLETVHLGDDPINAFSPLLSIYYLVREKQERERVESNPGALSMPQSPGEKPLKMPDLPAPAAAYTNATTFEMAGEAPTGGRARPRARTNGEEEMMTTIPNQRPQAPGVKSPVAEASPAKRENVAVGLLRRFSTRKNKDVEREKSTIQHPPSVVTTAPDSSLASPRKTLSIRKTRDREGPPSAFQNVVDHHPELLAPPSIASEGMGRRLKALGRSTSVNSADIRPKWTRRSGSQSPGPQPPAVPVPVEPRAAGGDATLEERDSQSRQRLAASRAKSMGHARRDSMQARRTQREQSKGGDLPEETDQDLANDIALGVRSGDNGETMKPVYLKGLFSVSTTSSKSITFIRADIIRVLTQLGVEHREIKGGFTCRHVPSIDLNRVVDNSAAAPASDAPSHRRKVSFAGLRHDERNEIGEQVRMPSTPKPAGRRPPTDSSHTNSDDSDDDVPRRSARSPRAAGETTTHVQSDLGSSMVLKFEILVVKVPFLSLHGLQFKKVDGGTWQYKRMAETILTELRL